MRWRVRWPWSGTPAPERDPGPKVSEAVYAALARQNEAIRFKFAQQDAEIRRARSQVVELAAALYAMAWDVRQRREIDRILPPPK